jgi:hypothetical protein
MEKARKANPPHRSPNNIFIDVLFGPLLLSKILNTLHKKNT